MSLWTGLVILAAVGGVWWRVERLTTRRLSDLRALRERELAIDEGKLKVEQAKSTVNESTADLPPDLFAWCMSESEPWAQEDQKKILRQLYGECHNWDQVRLRMRPVLARNLAFNERPTDLN